MPVARIVTLFPAESEELRRQLIAAGYSVKFAAPDENFDDADIVVAAANVHSDYALQYASEVAAEAGADIIVAPGVIAGSPALVPQAPSRTVPQQPRIVAEPPPLREDLPEEASVAPAGVLFGATDDSRPEKHEIAGGLREAIDSNKLRLVNAWQELKLRRESAAEQKRLEREQIAEERELRRRQLMEQRAVAEQSIAAERERLQLQRQAEQEKLRREQEEIRRGLEAERARIAAEAERERAEREQQAVLLAAQQLPITPVQEAPAAPAPPQRTITPPPLQRPPARANRPVRRRVSGREPRIQRAALYASVAALVAMLAFAAALNVHPSSPMPHSMVQNPVQEQSPFGTARITPAPVPARPANAAPAAHSMLPQRDAAPVSKKPNATHAARPARKARRGNYVAEDEVVIHHYGAPKHPPAAQTQAGVRKYSDQD